MNRVASLSWAGVALAVAALIAIYAGTLRSPLIFDDILLERAGFIESYKQLFPIKIRALSYGSFAWFAEPLGIASVGQRVINLLLHLATVVALTIFYLRLTPFFTGDSESGRAGGDAWKALRSEHYAALALAICVFAFNPMAVYAVAYLIQRSILMCTLFSVLALIATIRAAQFGGAQRWLLVIAFYAAAMLCKEYAIALPAVIAAIVVVVRRPSAVRLGVLSAVMLLIGVAMASALYVRYGRIIGTAFDDASVAFLKQLEGISPGTQAQAWPLSILNQTWLFFEYGWRWFFPNVGAMSVDMRPTFPRSVLEARYWLSAASYLTLFASSAFLLLKFRDWRGLLGFALFVPCALFVTEFATVWIQDPFVLYRSYLWAIGVPGVILAILVFLNKRFSPIAFLTLCIVAVFGFLALDRVRSMQSANAVWDDAAGKLTPEVTVGQSRIFNNRANARLAAGDQPGALKDFRLSTQLGDGGEGLLGIGILAAQSGQIASAASAFAGARQRGMDNAALNYNEGVVNALVGRLPEAIAAYDRALARPDAGPILPVIRAKRAMALIDLGRLDEARAEVNAATALAGNDPDVLQANAFVALAAKNFAAAITSFDRQLLLREDGIGLFGRAQARAGAGDQAGALIDVDRAIVLDPENPALRQLRERIARPQATAGAAPGKKP